MDYYVLPVPDVENQPQAYSMDSDSEEAFKTFVLDSRSLFRKHNLGVAEFDSPATFHVQFNASDTLAVRKYLEENSGVHKIRDVLYPTIQLGPFTLPDATHLKRKIEFDLPVEKVEIKRGDAQKD